ncbi:hypothetical protein [Photobacterium sp. 1_MG-2023]|uniref:hypothetical protein n=1 Tax=Photobacterium sp. 1_MG-2023 TaxID=3062646 RepID=UPI0026E2FF76|nr:hypothetical protein [Photobacterium sp. 1_MG-2023]MDO6705892.1 hypothetical protein [Photobacterium sp. 1_MG-2023]
MALPPVDFATCQPAEMFDSDGFFVFVSVLSLLCLASETGDKEKPAKKVRMQKESTPFLTPYHWKIRQFFVENTAE